MAMSRDDSVFMAKAAEQAERFEEMAFFMESLATSLPPGEELKAEERSLLSVAYKNVAASRRNARLVVSNIEQKEEERGEPSRKALIQDYRAKVEAEIADICDRVLRLLNVRLIPSASGAESTVFFLKMKGDYNRYLAEFKTGEAREDAALKALEAYKTAQEIAVMDLSPIHPVRLGLALNLCVFHYEISHSPEKAITLATETFDEAAIELDTLGEESYKDSTHIMRLLRDNLIQWTSDIQDDGANEIQGAPKQSD